MKRLHRLGTLGLAALLLTGCGGGSAPPPASYEAANQGVLAQPVAGSAPAPSTPPADATPSTTPGATSVAPGPPGTAPADAAEVAALQQQIAALQADKSQLQTEKAGLEKKLQDALKAPASSTLGQFQIQLGLTTSLLSEHLWTGLAAGTLAYDLCHPQVALQLDGEDHKPVLKQAVGPKAGEWDIVKAWAKSHAEVKQVGVLKMSDPNTQVTYLRVTDDQWLEMRWQFGRLAGLHLNSTGPDMGSVEWQTPNS